MGCCGSKTKAAAPAQAADSQAPTAGTPGPAAEPAAAAAPTPLAPADGQAKPEEPAAAAPAADAAAGAATEPSAAPAAPAAELVTIKVSIASARGLRKADFTGKSDPSCTCEHSAKPDAKVETAVAEGSLAPEWKHDFEVAEFKAGDSLSFTIKDKDEVLGKVTLAGEKFLESGFDEEIKLTETAEGIEAYLMLKVSKKVAEAPAEQPEPPAPPAPMQASEEAPVEPAVEGAVPAPKGMFACC